MGKPGVCYTEASRVEAEDKVLELRNPMSDSTQDTLKHIWRVQTLMQQAIATLGWRMQEHDKSKLEEPEKSGYDQITTRLKDVSYGSPEYRACLKELKPTVEHHYAHNSHHPEHYPNGVDGMSLLDLIEMLADWKAAGERHSDSSLEKSIAINEERFKLSPQLVAVLRNTQKELNW